MTNIPTIMLVVAAAFRRSDGLWLMHQRPVDKDHGGLWEFPGGKVEPGETPPNALVREVSEELGITISAAALEPCAFAHSGGNSLRPPIVILLYRIDEWTGQPQALEGGKVDWFSVSEIEMLFKPPLDVELAGQLFARLGGNS